MAESRPPPPPRRGRGAITNQTGRFEPMTRERVDDGWDLGDGEPPPRLDTVVTVERARTIIARNQSPDIGFEQSINPYRGCEHGCVYCYARPSHAYLGLSPGLDFETRLTVKANAAEVLERELRAPGYRPRPIMLGANTDPYQPVERRRGITRAVLQVLAAFRHPVMVTTKSALVTRDIDVLGPMGAGRLASVGISLTTLDRGLARTLEPRATTPAGRLDAIRALSEAGVPVTVLASPMIPFINDHELERILTAGREAGAVRAAWILIRLPLEVAPLFREWLDAHRPDGAERVLARIRDSHGGALYRSRFGARMTGTGAYAALLAERFRLACRRLGLNRLYDG
ncbi:MAG: PA0069 family radical SAM protein, partial [Rhodospirillales bacterium]